MEADSDLCLVIWPLDSGWRTYRLPRSFTEAYVFICFYVFYMSVICVCYSKLFGGALQQCPFPYPHTSALPTPPSPLCFKGQRASRRRSHHEQKVLTCYIKIKCTSIVSYINIWQFLFCSVVRFRPGPRGNKISSPELGIRPLCIILHGEAGFGHERPGKSPF